MTSVPHSVHIPAHNEEVVIRDTFESMCALQYPLDRLAAIVINDNSTDKKGEIVDEFAESYSFIKAIHTKASHTFMLNVKGTVTIQKLVH